MSPQLPQLKTTQPYADKHAYWTENTDAIFSKTTAAKFTLKGDSVRTDRPGRSETKLWKYLHDVLLLEKEAFAAER